MESELLEVSKAGLYCPTGDFYIDPSRSVDRAVVTHAHSDHARPGMKRYLCSKESERVLRLRVGNNAKIDTLEFGEAIDIGGTKLSLHPAGHIIGSSQIRVERDGQVVVVSGDYKTAPDSTCTPFEPIKCHTFITESTFGLPIYRWPSESSVFKQICNWWKCNQELGLTSVLLGYSLGKTQRALSGLDPEIGPIVLHGTLEPYTNAYRLGGVVLPTTIALGDLKQGFPWNRALILAPPNVTSSMWAEEGVQYSAAFMSGWMATRNARKRGSTDCGFVLSDHVDWPSMLSAIAATGAETVYVTHGFTSVVVRYLKETGIDARPLGSHPTSGA